MKLFGNVAKQKKNIIIYFKLTDVFEIIFPDMNLFDDINVIDRKRICRCR